MYIFGISIFRSTPTLNPMLRDTQSTCNTRDGDGEVPKEEVVVAAVDMEVAVAGDGTDVLTLT